MLKNKTTDELIDKIIEIGLEIEQYDCGNSVPPKSWTVQDLKRKGYRYYKALPEFFDIKYRENELVDALVFIPIDPDFEW